MEGIAENAASNIQPHPRHPWYQTKQIHPVRTNQVMEHKHDTRHDLAITPILLHGTLHVAIIYPNNSQSSTDSSIPWIPEVIIEAFNAKRLTPMPPSRKALAPIPPPSKAALQQRWLTKSVCLSPNAIGPRVDPKAQAGIQIPAQALVESALHP